jgi:hypothetical protein
MEGLLINTMNAYRVIEGNQQPRRSAATEAAFKRQQERLDRASQEALTVDLTSERGRRAATYLTRHQSAETRLVTPLGALFDGALLGLERDIKAMEALHQQRTAAPVSLIK